jgi:hypothetical protein
MSAKEYAVLARRASNVLGPLLALLLVALVWLAPEWPWPPRLIFDFVAIVVLSLFLLFVRSETIAAFFEDSSCRKEAARLYPELDQRVVDQVIDALRKKGVNVTFRQVALALTGFLESGDEGMPSDVLDLRIVSFYKSFTKNK